MKKSRLYKVFTKNRQPFGVAGIWENCGESIDFYDYDNHIFELRTGTLKKRLVRYAKDANVLHGLLPSYAARTVAFD
jgi:hypothetical protein